MRRTARVALGSGIALVVAAALSAPAAVASADRTGDVAAAEAVAAAPAAAAPAAAGHRVGRLTTLGLAGWKVVSSAIANQGGAKISTPGLDTTRWLPVTPDDAGAPGTELNALLQNGVCPNVFYADNMRKCFGYLNTVGPDTVPRFKVPWWYRTDFAPNLRPGQPASLVVNGVIGRADVWVDGHRVASSSTVTGAYTRFTFDVTGLLRAGPNSLAIEMFANDPTSMLTLDNVDWNQIPPDNNTGIQFPVQLEVAGALSDGNAHVLQINAADLSSSALTVKTDVTNCTGSSQTGIVTVAVTPPDDGEPIMVAQPVTVAGHATRTVTFAPAAFPALNLDRPRVWWPYQMGAQPLYSLSTAVVQNGAVAGSTHETFGIRTVTSSLVGKKTAEAPAGVRQYAVNGVPFVVRGGGFVPDLFLRYSAADIRRQVAILRNLGVNMLRLEGHMMPDDFYQQMGTPAARGASTASRAPATPCPQWTRSTGSCPPPISSTSGGTRRSTSTTPTTSPAPAATRSAPCSTSTPR